MPILRLVRRIFRRRRPKSRDAFIDLALALFIEIEFRFDRQHDHSEYPHYDADNGDDGDHGMPNAISD
jgi:hypothetical protein